MTAAELYLAYARQVGSPTQFHMLPQSEIDAWNAVFEVAAEFVKEAEHEADKEIADFKQEISMAISTLEDLL